MTKIYRTASPRSSFLCLTGRDNLRANWLAGANLPMYMAGWLLGPTLRTVCCRMRPVSLSIVGHFIDPIDDCAVPGYPLNLIDEDCRKNRPDKHSFRSTFALPSWSSRFNSRTWAISATWRQRWPDAVNAFLGCYNRLAAAMSVSPPKGG